VRYDLIDGVRVKEMRNVVTRNGVMVELYRSDWGIGAEALRHVIHVAIRGMAVSAWHCHEKQLDHVTVTAGAIRLVLYDAREDSPTHGKLNEFHMSPMRPMLVVIPPGVWHGIRNLVPEPSVYVSFFDRAYNYADPDEWRLPVDTDRIPCRI
jgi:dTDP-4-dehydrorhamnose 3,5-epimerase